MLQSKKQDNGGNQSASELIRDVNNNQRSGALRVEGLFNARRGNQGEDGGRGLRVHAKRLLRCGDAVDLLGVVNRGEDGGGANEASDEGVDVEAADGVDLLDVGDSLDALVDGKGAAVDGADDETEPDEGEEELGKGREDEGLRYGGEGGAVEEDLANAIVREHFFF